MIAKGRFLQRGFYVAYLGRGTLRLSHGFTGPPIVRGREYSSPGRVLKCLSYD